MPDLHPKVTYCFSEGSAVSYHAILSFSESLFELNRPSFSSHYDCLGPQWHVTVCHGKLCQRAGKTFV